VISNACSLNVLARSKTGSAYPSWHDERPSRPSWFWQQP
jgi:hypothetical protein